MGGGGNGGVSKEWLSEWVGDWHVGGGGSGCVRVSWSCALVSCVCVSCVVELYACELCG
jgi:hypothetical protein